MSTQSISYKEFEEIAAKSSAVLPDVVKVLDIRYWNDPILSTVCSPVRDTEYGSALELFGQRMIDTMNFHKGVGLAAPQIGVPIRMFVMHTFVKHEGSLLLPIVVCNPVLELKGEVESDREGCLSTPDIFESVTRYHTAVMRYFSPLGVETEVELHAMNARVVQHETDHLDGIMFFDRRRVSRQTNRSVERQWENKRKRYTK